MGLRHYARAVFGRCCVFLMAFASVLPLVLPVAAAAETTSLRSRLTSLVSKITGSNAQAPKKDPRTRFIVALSRPTKFQVFALSKPNRVIVDLGSVGIRLPDVPENPVGVVTSFRGGADGAGRTRVVINVSEPVVINSAVIKPRGVSGGPELVIDMMPVKAKLAHDEARKSNEAKFRKAKMGLGIRTPRFQPPLPRAAQSPDALNKKTYRPLIVVDPGHGGHDSGARKYGLREKDVVLAFALKLRDKLLATNRYRVIMTRATDVFIPLGVRRSIAEKHGAALFISVHADYARPGARGATIYSLRRRVAKRLKATQRSQAAKSALSKTEEAKIQKASANVAVIRKILGDLAGRDVEATQTRTSDFSHTVVEYMSASTNMRNDPDKEAAFKVLRTQKVPAVLIELAYISNKRDARNLTSDQWRNKVSGSIVSAVDRYFSRNAKPFL